MWAAGVAVAASRTSNPLVHLLIVAALAVTVACARRYTDVTAATRALFATFLRLGLLTIAIRLVFGLVFGTGTTGGPVLFTVPTVALPTWTAGVSIGGPVTSGGMLASVAAGLWLTTLLAAVAAANVLADPRELLRSVPGALYEVGVSIVVALTFAPQLVADARRIRTARRLRGQSGHGIASFARTAVPVLEGGLEQAMVLAASMDSRGYGRRGAQSPARRRVVAGSVLASLGLLGFGLLALLGLGGNTVGLTCVLAGAAIAGVGLVAGGQNTRSRYRSIPWSVGELVVLVSSSVLVAVYLAAVSDATPGIDVDVTTPSSWTLPTGPSLAALLVVVPAAVVAARATSARASSAIGARPVRTP
jgi:energy-coupling factor transport system permease protein